MSRLSVRITNDDNKETVMSKEKKAVYHFTYEVVEKNCYDFSVEANSLDEALSKADMEAAPGIGELRYAAGESPIDLVGESLLVYKGYVRS